MTLSLDNPVRAHIKNEIQAIQNTVDTIDIGKVKEARTTPFKEIIPKATDEVSLITKKIEDIGSKLQKIDRPRIAPVLKKVKSAERREVALSVLQEAARTVGMSA